MNCPEFQERLQQRLDGEPRAAADKIERHLAVCPSCRELETSASRLLDGLRARVVGAPPEGLKERIVTAALAEIASQRLARRQWRRGVMAASAVAAGLLVATYWGISRWGFRPESRSPGSVTVARQDEKLVPMPAKNSLNIQEAGSALVALVNRTADETVGQGRMLLPQNVQAPNLSVAESWQPDLEPSAQAFRGAQDGVTDSLEPVTSSARRAVNLFLQEIPSLETQKQ